MALQVKLKSPLAVLLALSLMWLSGCGFHLRGAVDVDSDKQKIYLQGDATDLLLQRSLSAALRDNQINQTTGAPYRLSLVKSRYRRDSVSLDSSAQVDEYELKLSVVYELHSVQNESTERYTAIAERIYSYDTDAAAAKDEQEALLKQEMYDSIANQIIRNYLAFNKAK